MMPEKIQEENPLFLTRMLRGHRLVRLIGTIAMVSMILVAGVTVQLQHRAAYACDDNIIVDGLDGGGYYADISSAVQSAYPESLIEAHGTYTYTNARTGQHLGSGYWDAPSPLTLPTPPAGQRIMYEYRFTGTLYIDGNPQCASGFIDIGS